MVKENARCHNDTAFFFLFNLCPNSQLHLFSIIVSFISDSIVHVNDMDKECYFISCIAACASKFPRYASDFGLIVPNGSYAISASHCVQCSCGPGNLK